MRYNCASLSLGRKDLVVYVGSRFRTAIFRTARVASPKTGKQKCLSYRKPRRNTELVLSQPLFELQKVS